ncbi:hypothetical protein ONZ45_g2486 [Pleurotus djamor]|nr:hypothetical protein ONZ45_g2486 [Pleurotus djamor]
MIHSSLILVALSVLGGALAAPPVSGMDAMHLADKGTPQCNDNSRMIIEQEQDTIFSLLIPQPGNSDEFDKYCSGTMSNAAKASQGCKPFPKDAFQTAGVTQKALNPGQYAASAFFIGKYNQDSSLFKNAKYTQYSDSDPMCSKCENFDHFRQIIDPANGEACVKCCNNSADCEVSGSATCAQLRDTNKKLSS